MVGMVRLMEAVEPSPDPPGPSPLRTSPPAGFIRLVMDRVDRLVEEVCERYRGIAADEDRYPRERERHGRKERSEKRKKRDQRPWGEGRLVVAGVIDDRVGAL